MKKSAHGWSVRGPHALGQVLVVDPPHDVHARVRFELVLKGVRGGIVGQVAAACGELRVLLGDEAIERVVEDSRYHFPHLRTPHDRERMRYPDH